MSSVAVIWSEERTKPPGCVQNRISTPSWCDTRMMLSFIRIAPAKGGFFADLLIKPRKNAEHAESLTRTPTGQAARRHSFALNSFASAERSKGRSPTNSYASFEHRNRFLQCPNGLRLTVPPGLLILSVANPEFRSCLAALGATVCRPSGTCLNVGRYRWLARSLLPPSLPRVPLVPRCTRGYCLPSLRDLSQRRSLPLACSFPASSVATPSSARASLHSWQLSAVPPGLVSGAPLVSLVPASIEIFGVGKLLPYYGKLLPYYGEVVPRYGELLPQDKYFGGEKFACGAAFIYLFDYQR